MVKKYLRNYENQARTMNFNDGDNFELDETTKIWIFT